MRSTSHASSEVAPLARQPSRRSSSAASRAEQTRVLARTHVQSRLAASSMSSPVESAGHVAGVHRRLGLAQCRRRAESVRGGWSASVVGSSTSVDERSPGHDALDVGTPRAPKAYVADVPKTSASSIGTGVSSWAYVHDCGFAVRAPAHEGGGVAEAVLLQVVVGDLAHRLGPQRLPGHVLAGVPAVHAARARARRPAPRPSRPTGGPSARPSGRARARRPARAGGPR